MNARRIALAALLCSLTGMPAFASGFLLFQHGGRTTGQAGAFAARASDPSAVRFNPAALVRLDGFQFQAGLDFQAPKDEFTGEGRADSPEHVIQFPPALYASYRPDESSFAFGLSVDSPFWSIQNWNTALFPGRFDTLRQELTLFELRPSAAWAIDDRWSLGGSLRYVRGALETSFATQESLLTGAPHTSELAEIHSEAATTVDGIGVDLALHYAADGWGAGLVASSGVSLDGDGDIHHFSPNPFLSPGAEDDFERRFTAGSAAMDFELPPTLTAGFFWEATETLDLEVDVAWSGWSKLDRTQIELDQHPWSGEPPALDRRRDWEDVISIRVGAERDFGTGGLGWVLGGGLAWEPSPVPDSTAEPGFPRGDAYAAALGASYNFEGLSFDLGYSYFFYEDREAVLNSAIPTGGLVPVHGEFSARSQVFSVSARWRR
jgi:long-chain fatty acid transport protein